MKMNKKFAEQAQFFLEVLALEPITIAWILRDCSRFERQCAVDFIYRIVICDLAIIYPETILTKSDEYSYDGIKDFCHTLAVNHPYDGESVIWIDSHFGLSVKGMAFLRQYHPEAFEQSPGSQPPELNASLIEALEKIFEDYGLGWDEEHPLFPVSKP
ncbi:hypothetical protein ACFPVS_13320 [Neisseria weixii]|uniref:hypothetical protein n=1 Tax=Neisseria weixii TaxID=1853276 RepID=UPI000BB79A38|nr:hypothetical protein [Neisseria weixii]ATD64937.1 hypothetical protein CGZ65_05685 [Neisseria weixii]